MTANTDKQPSLITVTTDALRNLITKSSSVSNELLDAAERGAKIINTTAKYAQASNAAWAAEGMSAYTAEQRAFIDLIDKTLELPPVEGKKD